LDNILKGSSGKEKARHPAGYLSSFLTLFQTSYGNAIYLPITLQQAYAH
jgi:hypothetical protein